MIISWEPVIPYQYQKGALIEEESEDCILINWINIDINSDYICDTCPYPVGTLKYVARTNQGITISAECDSSNVIYQSEMENRNITSVTIGDCVNILDYALFLNHTNLNNVSIPSSVINMGDRIFMNCYHLKSVNLQGRINRIGIGAFADCNELSGITIPDSVKVIDWGAFSNCRSLTHITIPDSVRTIAKQAFDGCSGMTSVNIGNNVKTIGLGAFGNCSFRILNLPNSVKEIGDYAFGNNPNLSCVNLGSVEKISTEAFRYCPSLKNLIIPSTVKYLGKNIDYGTNLTSITILATTPPEILDDTPIFIQENNCPIYVPQESLEAYRNAGYGSVFVSRLQPISGSVTPSICSETYRTVSGTPYCNGYDKYIDVSTQVSYDSGSTWNTISTNNVLLEQNSPYCGYSPTVPKFTAIYNGGSTYELSCNDSSILTSGETRPNGYDIANMTSVVIGNCVTEIGGNCFMSSSLTNVTIPNGITTIGGYSFGYITTLQSITLPDSVTNIAASAFRWCQGLNSITVLATTPPTLGSNAFGNTALSVIYVPSSSVAAYKAASRWSSYSSIIQGI